MRRGHDASQKLIVPSICPVIYRFLVLWMLVKFVEFWPLSFIENNHVYLVANDEK
jgi:hypothetical protein